MFWTHGAKVSQESFAPPKPCFAPVQPFFAPVQEDFGTLGPKHLLHPLLTTFGKFPVSGPLPEPWGRKPWAGRGIISILRWNLRPVIFGVNFSRDFPEIFLRNFRNDPRKSHSLLEFSLECRKWGFKTWGFKEIRGYLRKKAFFLRFLDFPGALRTLRKRAKKAEKGRKRPISADFREGRPDTP